VHLSRACPSSCQESSDPDRLAIALSSLLDISRLLPLLSLLSSRFFLLPRGVKEGQRAKVSVSSFLPGSCLSGSFCSFFYRVRHVSDSPARELSSRNTLDTLPKAWRLVCCRAMQTTSNELGLSRVMIDRSASIPVPLSAVHPRYLHCGPKCLPRHFARGHAAAVVRRQGRSSRHGLICPR
jgi:hypothetical protein